MSFPDLRRVCALTSLERRVGLGDVPGHSGEQRDAVLGRGDGVRRGRVDDEAPVLGGGGEIDVVDPDPGAPHDAEPSPGCLEHVAPHLGPRPHDERVAERDLGAELLGGEAVGAVHVGEPRSSSSPAAPSFSATSTVGFPVRHPRRAPTAPRSTRRRRGRGGGGEAARRAARSGRRRSEGGTARWWWWDGRRTRWWVVVAVVWDGAAMARRRRGLGFLGETEEGGGGGDVGGLWWVRAALLLIAR